MHSTTRKPTRPALLLLLGALLLPTLARAADDADKQSWYDVEVIVFAENHPDFSSEVWPAFPGTPDIAQARDLQPAGSGQPQAFQQLDPADYQLDGVYKRLVKSKRYTPLLHIAWRQQGLPPEKAVAVHIHVGDEPSQPDTAAATAKSDAAAPAPQATDGRPADGTDGTANSDANAPPPRLDGTLKLILSRYLHLDADLVYRTEMPVQKPAEPDNTATQKPQDGGTGDGDAAPAATDDAAAGQNAADTTAQPTTRLQPFRLQESRRIRSRELHYMDNPVFGIIAEVIPYEPPKPKPEAKPQKTAPADSGSGPTGTIQR